MNKTQKTSTEGQGANICVAEAPTKYVMVEEGKGYPLTAQTLEAAVKECEAKMDYGDYQTGCDSDGTTVFVAYLVQSVERDEDGEPLEEENGTVTLQPDEPECQDGPYDEVHDEHDWDEGETWGHGGGVKITDQCQRCGLRREINTWGQNPADGTQGHRVVTYTQGEGEMARLARERRAEMQEAGAQ